MIRKFYDNGIEGSGFGGDPLNPFEGAKKEDFGKPIVDDKKEPVVDEKKEPIVDDKKEPVVDEKKEPIVDEKKEPVVDKKEPIVDDKKEPVVDKKEPEVKQPALNFDEELKKTDKWETLKKLGFDDFEIGLLKYKAETGDLAPYLEVKTVDYSKMSDEQMMKYHLRKENPDLSDTAFDQLYKEEVTDKYLLDAEVHGVATAELRKYQLKKAADALRKSSIEGQAKFKAPEKLIDDSAQKIQKANEDKIREYKEFVDSNDNTKALLKDKKLVFGTGDASFNYTVDNPQAIVETLHQPQLLFKDLVDDKGNVDVAKFNKAKAYMANMEGIEKMLIDHGKTLGTKEYIDGLQNPSKKAGDPAINLEPELTPAQALAKNGKIRVRDN
jgi:hypothetical protein